MYRKTYIIDGELWSSFEYEFNEHVDALYMKKKIDKLLGNHGLEYSAPVIKVNDKYQLVVNVASLDIDRIEKILNEVAGR